MENKFTDSLLRLPSQEVNMGVKDAEKLQSDLNYAHARLTMIEQQKNEVCLVLAFLGGFLTGAFLCGMVWLAVATSHVK